MDERRTENPRDEAAQDAEVIGAVYDELHRLAQKFLRAERGNHTLQPTALVHEAYLKLAGNDRRQWQDAAHFRALASVAMRRVLVDHARGVGAQKRSKGNQRVTLSDVQEPSRETGVDVLALHEALLELAELNHRQARLVELRFFGGLTLEEAAAQLAIARSTAAADWSVARAWLSARLAGPGGG